MYNVQYIVVRKDLIEKFGFGFMSAQICHASVAPITNAIKGMKYYNKSVSIEGSRTGLTYDKFYPAVDGIIDQALYDWCTGRFVKYVYEVPDLNALNDLCDRLEQDGIEFYKITELVNKDEEKVNQTTCIGLKPYDKGRVAPCFKNISLLK